MGQFLSATILSAVLFSSVATANEQSTPPADIMTEACEQELTGTSLVEARNRWAGKTVILDTNVLLNDPFAYLKFPSAQVLISTTVLEEMDQKKTDLKTGRAARQFFRNMSRLMQSGEATNGFKVGADTILKFDDQNYMPDLAGSTYDPTKKDNEILATAKHYSREAKDKGGVVLISDDGAVRLKAAVMGIVALPFEYEWVTPAKDVKQAFYRYETDEKTYAEFLEKGIVAKPDDLKMAPNEFVLLHSATQPETPDTMARYFYDRQNPEKSGLRKLVDLEAIGAPFRERNLEQHMALDVLLDKSVELVMMEAFAGTGKTFITMMAALMQIQAGGNSHFRNRYYDDVMITKQLSDVGPSKLGTLPGGAGEKLSEDFNSFYDNMRVIWDKLKNRKSPSVKNQEVQIAGVELMVFSKVRGRSLHNSFIVVDEAQNIGIHEAKTILTRAGEGTKMVLLGDASQIDMPYLNERNNGLSVSINLFTSPTLSDGERSRVAFVKLTDGVRSELAKLAAKVYSNPLPHD